MKEYGTADGRRWTQIAPTALNVVDDAADLETGVAEVQQQGQMQAGSFQIIHALRDVDAVEGSHCFQFDDDAVINQEIGGVLTNHNAIVSNNNRMLLRNFQAILPKFVRQAIFIDLFQKSRTHGVQDREGAADYALRSSVQCSFICVHLRPSAVPYPFLIEPADWLSSSL